MQTIEEIRHANLHLLAESGHSQSDIARAIDVDRRQVNQWFVSPPLRNLSSENARAIEQKLLLEPGSLDHPGLGEPASQLPRPDREILRQAIAVAMDSPHELTVEAVLGAYDLLIERASPRPAKEMTVKKSKGQPKDDAVKRRDPGTIANPRRKDGPGEA